MAPDYKTEILEFLKIQKVEYTPGKVIFFALQENYRARIDSAKPAWWRENFPKSWDYWHRPHEGNFESALLWLLNRTLIRARPAPVTRRLFDGSYQITRRGINRMVHKPNHRNFGIPPRGTVPA